MYNDPKYDVEQIVSVPEVLNGTGTFTASDHADSADDVSKVEFFNKVKLLAVKALIDTKANAGATTPFLRLMNGTTTLADIAFGTHTAGEIIDGTIASAAVAAATELQIDLVGTGTASEALDLGSYYLFISYQRAYE